MVHTHRVGKQLSEWQLDCKRGGLDGIGVATYMRHDVETMRMLALPITLHRIWTTRAASTYPGCWRS